jgi:hypothetical protein
MTVHRAGKDGAARLRAVSWQARAARCGITAWGRARGSEDAEGASNGQDIPYRRGALLRACHPRRAMPNAAAVRPRHAAIIGGNFLNFAVSVSQTIESFAPGRHISEPVVGYCKIF